MSKSFTSGTASKAGRRALVRVMPDGSRVRIQPKPLAPATVTDDPDCPELTAERIARMKRVPRVRSLRRALGLTQEEFAARYALPLGTLRDWEQGRTEPDQPARAYLRVIAANPKAVAKALEASEG